MGHKTFSQNRGGGGRRELGSLGGSWGRWEAVGGGGGKGVGFHLHHDGKQAPVSFQRQDLKTTTATTEMCTLTFRSSDTSSCSCFIPQFYQSISERREENVPSPERRRLFSITDQTEAPQMQYLKEINSVSDGKDGGFSQQQLMFLCRHKACGRPGAAAAVCVALMDVSLHFASIHQRQRRLAAA